MDPWGEGYDGFVDPNYVFDAVFGPSDLNVTVNGVGGWRAMAAKSLQLTKNMFGKGNPTKFNRGGKLQPFDAKTGQYLPHSSDPGVTYSPVRRFTAGFSSGFTEGYTGVSGAVGVGRAGSIGQELGRIFGTVASFF